MMEPSQQHRRSVAELFPQLVFSTFEPVGDGWDRFTYEVNGEWIFQFPRLPGSDESLRRQIALLPELARELSAPIPVPELVSHDPLCMGYRKLEGTALSDEPAAAGILPERLGRFLYDLHLVPPELVGLRADRSRFLEARAEEVRDFRARVVPLLPPADRPAATGVLDDALDVLGSPRSTLSLVHGDLGPEHVLSNDAGDLAGVIDWGDAGIGDPAIDFAWLLNGAPASGERALAAYGGAPDPGFRRRALAYHRLGPWHEVTYGLTTGRRAFVASGLEGIRVRLPSA